MLEAIIKAVTIGIAAAIPVGPLAIFVFQKSMAYGRAAGMRCSLGAIFSDFIYALFSIFAYSLIADFINTNTVLLEIAGGAIIMGVGASMAFGNPTEAPKRKRSTLASAMDVTKSILMGFANPGCLAWMIALFATFKLDALEYRWYETIIILFSVSAGSVLYWLGFTWLAAKGNGRVKLSTILRINRISGVLVIAFGVFALVKGIIDI